MATNNNNSPQQPAQRNGPPSSSTFDFKAPFPVSASALKTRRVSLASPSSPRLVQPFPFRDEMGLLANAPSSSGPEKKGKMRRLDNGEDLLTLTDKKPRKKWSTEETQMLVQGCQKHGVGNWKTILLDPELKFHDRSPVDLKDRFRTYFPDAYKKHYPNARTHLSSKVRSTLSDGTSLFEKTRSKRRRPFTEAEDRALKAGYEKHGTTWATIVKDPIFQEQARRSTDLRDRFRNAFPDLYQAAGYKPRTAAKKKLDGPQRAADDQLSAISGAGPVRSRRRAQTSQGLLRGGTKSVPQSTAVSEDEESSAGEEEDSESIFKTPPTPVFVDNVSTAPYRPTKKAPGDSPHNAFRMDADAADPDDDDAEMQLVNEDNTDPLHIPDFLPNHAHADMDTWSAGLSTPTHSSTAAWSTAGASPSSSHLESASSDFLMRAAGNHHQGHGHSHSLSASASASLASSPFLHRRGPDALGNANLGMIGKSAWTEDWFLPNPRLDSRNSGNSSDAGGGNGPAVHASVSGRFSPPSPWSFNHAHLHGGVLDRYDLFPPYMPDAPGSASDAGLGDPHSFDELGFGFGAGGYGAGQGMGGNGAGPSAGGTGFKGYHSQFAGDLISANAGGRFGSTSSTSAFSSFAPGGGLSMSLSSLSGMYGPSFAGSSSAFGGGGNNGELESGITGLGLEGIPQNTGIHPMQLHAHTPSLLAIDELGLTGISLDDHERDHSDVGGLRSGNGDAGSGRGAVAGKDSMETTEERAGRMGFGCLPRSPTKHTPKGNLKEEPDPSDAEAFPLDDLVDMELHATPPATPLMTQPRPMRRATGTFGFGFDAGQMGGAAATQQHHARSISVPPGEARNGGVQLGVPMSMDDVGLHMHHGHVNYGFFNAPLASMSGHGSADHQHQEQQQQQQHQHQYRHPASSPMRLSMSNSTSSIHSPISPVQQQQQQHNSSQLTPLIPHHLILSSPSSAGLASPPSASSGHPSPHTLNTHNEELWRSFGTGAGPAAVDYSYNLPFLDLHYYGHASYGAGMTMLGHPGHPQNSLGLDVLDEQAELASSARQGQAALDLAQSAALTSMGGLNGGLGLGLGLPLRAFDTPSPVGTIRHHPNTNGRDKPTLSELFGGPASTPHPPPPPPPPPSGNDTHGGGRNAGGGRNGESAGGMGTIRQTHGKGAAGALGRSMSHHRGQSAVCPQDLMLRNDNNKRKRASWDGGVV